METARLGRLETCVHLSMDLANRFVNMDTSSKASSAGSLYRLRCAVLLLGVFILVFWTPGVLLALRLTSPRQAQAPAQLAGLSVPFIKNEQQWDSEVTYAASTFAGNAFVTRQGGIVYSLPPARSRNRGAGGSLTKLTRQTTDPPKPERAAPKTRGAAEQDVEAPRGWTLVERFVGGRARVECGEPAITKVSSFTGKDPRRWWSGAPTCNRLFLGDVWPGIRVSLRAYGQNVEKIYEVAAGAAPESIRMEMEGAKWLRIAEDGALVVGTGFGEVRWRAPVAYQVKNGTRVPVQVAYRLEGRNRYRVQLGTYDRNLPLVIDPSIQSTYLGGSDRDLANFSIFATNLAVYVVGSTRSFDFPGTSGGAQSTHGGPISDAFVAKLSLDLQNLEQATYIGGSDLDAGRSLFVTDSAVYVVGRTASADFPATAGGAQPSSGGGGGDGFIAALSLDLTSLIQSTYFGGSGVDEAHSVSVTSNAVYVAGVTDSSDLPNTAGGAQPTYAGNNDAFLVRLGLSLTSIDQATYLGGSDSEKLASAPLCNVAVDGGSVYVSGYTNSADFPQTNGGAQPTWAGGGDSFVARLPLDLSAIDQATYLGGTGDDVSRSLVVTAAGVYVAGETASSDFPGTTAGAQPSHAGGGTDGFIAKLNPTLTSLQQATYFGGSNLDHVTDVRADGSGAIYVSGQTASEDLPGTAGAAQPDNAGLNDGFLAQLNESLTSLVRSTYFGGSSNDEARALFVTANAVYLAGLTSSTDLPGTSGGFQPNFGGGADDAFVARFFTNLGACAPMPLLGCKQSTVSKGASLLVRNFASPSKSDQLAFRLGKGNATSLVELGDPLTPGATEYTLCIYESGSLVYSVRIPAGGTCGSKPCWAALKAGKGYRYRNTELFPDGSDPLLIRSLRAVVGPEGKSRIRLGGRGKNMSPLPALPMTPPVRVQVSNREGTCWEAEFSAYILKNTAEVFRAKSD